MARIIIINTSSDLQLVSCEVFRRCASSVLAEREKGRWSTLFGRDESLGHKGGKGLPGLLNRSTVPRTSRKAPLGSRNFSKVLHTRETRRGTWKELSGHHGKKHYFLGMTHDRICVYRAHAIPLTVDFDRTIPSISTIRAYID